MTQLFNHLTGYSRSTDYRTLIVAPKDLRRRMVELIENEASHGRAGHITMKVNSLADEAIIEALYAASEAGVEVDLVVRGSAVCDRACPA